MKSVLYYLLLSVSAFVLIFIISIGGVHTTNTITFFDRMLVSLTFFASCVFGISIAVYPNWWRRKKFIADNETNFQKEKTSRAFKGHHPDCDVFKDHIIIIKNKALCAGCLGLILGAILATILMAIYLINPLRLSIDTYYIFLASGVLALIFIYIEIIFLKRRTLAHIFLNVLLIISFFAVTISVVELTANPIYGVLAVLFSFLWLDTRIHFSKYQHKKICKSCKQSCKSYLTF